MKKNNHGQEEKKKNIEETDAGQVVWPHGEKCGQTCESCPSKGEPATTRRKKKLMQKCKGRGEERETELKGRQRSE